MKKSILFVAAVLMLTAVSCNKNSILPDNTNRDTFVGTWYVETNGKIYASEDTSKSFPIAMVDTMVITAAEQDGYCHVKCGRLDADAQVTSSGLQIPAFVLQDSVTGTGYTYSYNLTMTNQPATVSLGIMTWKSSVSGKVSAGVVGAEVEYSATGSLTSRGIKK